ncbi:snRNA-activating protein complex subunit 4 [Xenentodon cancila]
MSISLSAERDRIRRQVEELEQSLSVTQTELDLLSSDTDENSDSDDVEDEVGQVQSAAGLLAQKEKIQKEIQNLEGILGPHRPIFVSDDDNDSRSSDESDLGLSSSVDSCLQLNLVYQQVVEDALDQLETLLTHNRRQQRELLTQISGPIKESSRDQPPRSSYQLPAKMFLGRFLKPYFKDKLTGLGPPANEEAKQRALRMTGCLDDKKLKPKRWESWQKTLLIHSVARDGLKRLVQPKLSRVDYLTQKMSSAEEAERQQLRENIEALEAEMDLLRDKKEEELIGDRYEEHDWQKISNIDFEGTKDAEDIRLFWQNFLHPSVNKFSWSKEEVQQLKEVSRRHQENHWEEIAEELGTGRTGFMCLQMFQRFVSDSLKRGSWTPDEDALLRELVDKMRIGNFIPYTQMSYFMEGREPGQLIYRWNQVLDPSLKKGLWSKEEDQLLLQAVAHLGEKWWKVRLEVPGRTDSACRDRYLDCLKMDLKKGPFDEQERELLQKLVQKYGVGRWSKIAAEIPHRVDAQCLREWKRLSKPPHQIRKKAKNRKKAAPVKAKKRIRKRLVQIKEEMLTEDEDEDEVVQYMDSDDEKKKKGKQMVVKKADKAEEEEEEEEEVGWYSLPPMQDWVPAEKPPQDPSLSFHPAMLPSSSEVGNGNVRSTILGKSGRSVVIGPRPQELHWEERHSSCAMMMVSRDQLRAHWSRLALKFKNHGLQKRITIGNQSISNRVMEYKLRAAVMPWVGNLLIASKARRMVADVQRETGERGATSSTAIFLLLLQVMNVDSLGCKEMIEKRRSRTSQAPPTPARSTSSGSNQTVSTAKSLNVAPPPSTVISKSSALLFSDHSYTCFSPCSRKPTPKQSGPAPSKAPTRQSRGRKRQREAEPQELVRSLAEQSVDGSDTSTGVAEEGKRLRRPSLKAKALQEAKQAQAETRRSSSSPMRKRRLRCHSQDDVVAQTPPLKPGPTLHLAPGQTMWIMTSAGLVQLVQAVPPGLALKPSTAHMPSRGTISNPLLAPPPVTAVSLKPVTASVNLPIQKQECPVPAQLNRPFPMPPPRVVLPYKGVVRVNSLKAPPLRREGLQFDPSLMFLEPPEVVHNWLSGWRGVVVPGARVALPYMPPFVGSLTTLSVLLQSMTSLRQTSLQLLDLPRSQPKPVQQTRTCTTQYPPDLPDSTSDRPGTPPDPSDPPTAQQEEEQVKVVRQLVAERFSTNPAYQLLKTRFLSCFTVPALLATINPVRKDRLPCQTKGDEGEEDQGDEGEEDQGDEGDEDKEMKIFRASRRRKRVKVSLKVIEMQFLRLPADIS